MGLRPLRGVDQSSRKVKDRRGISTEERAQCKSSNAGMFIQAQQTSLGKDVQDIVELEHGAVRDEALDAKLLKRAYEGSGLGARATEELKWKNNIRLAHYWAGDVAC